MSEIKQKLPEPDSISDIMRKIRILQKCGIDLGASYGRYVAQKEKYDRIVADYEEKNRTRGRKRSKDECR